MKKITKTILKITLAFGGLLSTNLKAQQVLDQSVTDVTNNGYLILCCGGQPAQSFTCGITGNLTQADLYLKPDQPGNCGPGDFYISNVTVFDGAGNGGTLLATSDNLNFGYTGHAFDLRSYTFSTPPALTSGNVYTLYLNYVGSSCASNNGTISWAFTNTTTYAEGICYYMSNVYGGDLMFQTWMTCNGTPAAPTASGAIICGGTTASLTAAGTGTTSWYTAASGGTYLGGGVGYTYITPVLFTDSTFYVQDSTCSASITRTAVTVTVNHLPPVTASVTDTVVCNGTLVTFTGGGATSYVWAGGTGVVDGVAYHPTSTDTYTVTGIDGNNCSNTASVTVIVHQPPVITMNHTDTTICGGTSIILAGSGASIYTWTGGVTNGVPFTPLGSATYSVTGTDGNNCNATNAINVFVDNINVFGSVTDSIVCPGTLVIFSGWGANNYAWTGGVIEGVPFTPVSTMTYTVTGTSLSGCVDTATLTVIVNTSPFVTASVSEDTICAGTAVTFSGGGALTYSWNGGVTDGVPYTLAGTGTHIVYGTDANGCWDSASVTVYVNNLPDVSTTSMGASISAVNQTGATYQWIDCDNNFAMITGEINPSYTAGANGDYSVVISSLGCVDTSSCVNIFSVGAAQNELENNISIYPNPAISEFTIEYKESIIKNHDVTIEVYDMSGKLVKSEQRIVNSGISYFKTNIEEFKNGIYFVRLLDDDSKVLYSQTVIKQ